MFKVVGITGGIGSGKSTVCAIFKEFDISIFNSDTEAKKILLSDKQVKKNIKELLGKSAYHTNGKPNKKHIAEKIFNDPLLREKINAIVHPAVKMAAERFFELQKASGAPYAIQESALLIETGIYRRCDIVILVTAPHIIKINRLIKRDGISVEDIEKRMSSQMTDKEKSKFAHHIINNDGKHELIQQVIKIHEQLK